MALQTISGDVKSYYKGSGTLTRYTFVKLDANGKIVPVSAATDYPIGVVLETTTKTNIPVPVKVHGVCRVLAGGTVTAGKLVKINASGEVVDATPDWSTERIVGKALESGGDGDYVEIAIF